MDTIKPTNKPPSRRRYLWIFLAGIATGFFVIIATCGGGFIYLYVSSMLSTKETENDFLTTVVGYTPESREGIQLEIQSLLGVDLPDSTLVMRKDSRGWMEPWLSMVFRTSEAHANELTALLDERYPVMGAEELVDIKSFGEGGVMTPPVRAWRLPKESQVQMLVVRLVRISDGEAIWVVEDHLK